MVDIGRNQPTLIGVGVGPGDAELVTVKAVRTLAAADVILVPATERDAAMGRAESIVREACPEVADRIRAVPFSMAERHGVGPKRRAAWETSALAAEQAFAEGARVVVFATVGDPHVYSTFSYLADHVRTRVAGLRVETVPGITAMQALAAAGGVSLVEGQEVLALVPATAPPATLESVLDCADSVVFYKVGRRLPDITRLLADRNRVEQAVVGIDIGLPEQRIIPLPEMAPDDLPYFSAIAAPPTRTSTGARL